MLRDILKHSQRAGLLQEVPNLKEAINVMKVRYIPFPLCCFILTFYWVYWGFIAYQKHIEKTKATSIQMLLSYFDIVQFVFV